MTRTSADPRLPTDTASDITITFSNRQKTEGLALDGASNVVYRFRIGPDDAVDLTGLYGEAGARARVRAIPRRSKSELRTAIVARAGYARALAAQDRTANLAEHRSAERQGDAPRPKTLPCAAVRDETISAPATKPASVESELRTQACPAARDEGVSEPTPADDVADFTVEFDDSPRVRRGEVQAAGIAYASGTRYRFRVSHRSRVQLSYRVRGGAYVNVRRGMEGLRAAILAALAQGDAGLTGERETGCVSVSNTPEKKPYRRGAPVERDGRPGRARACAAGGDDAVRSAVIDGRATELDESIDRTRKTLRQAVHEARAARPWMETRFPRLWECIRFAIRDGLSELREPPVRRTGLTGPGRQPHPRKPRQEHHA